MRSNVFGGKYCNIFQYIYADIFAIYCIRILIPFFEQHFNTWHYIQFIFHFDKTIALNADGNHIPGDGYHHLYINQMDQALWFLFNLFIVAAENVACFIDVSS